MQVTELSNLESEIRKAVAASDGKLSPWGLLEFFGYGVCLISFPAGLLIGLGAIVAGAIENRTNLSEEKMPDEWLEEVSNAPGITDKGLKYLAGSIKKKGFVSAKDAIRFIEIEKEEADKQRKKTEKEELASKSGAQKLLDRAKVQSETVDAINDSIISGARFAGSVTSEGANIALKFLRVKK